MQAKRAEAVFMGDSDELLNATISHGSAPVKPPRVREPLGFFGVVAGLVAGGVILPRQCEFSSAQAERLHVALPLAMPVALMLMSMLFARAIGRPRVLTWVAAALGLALGAETIFIFAASLAYGDPIGLVAGWLFFWPLLVAVVIVVMMVVAAARSAARVAELYPEAVLEREVWAVALAAAPVVTAVVLPIYRRELAWPAYAAWGLGALSVPVLIGFIVADARARPFVRVDAAKAVVGGANPYREPPELDRFALLRDRGRTAIALGIAVLATIAGVFVLGMRPPPE
jgi:hypothetical protein